MLFRSQDRTRPLFPLRKLNQEEDIVLQDYRKHVEERAVEGIPPKPLNAEQVAGLVELIKNPPEGEADNLLELLSERVPPGVDEAAYVKAGFLSAIVKGEDSCSLISKEKAIELLGNMHGGYNIVTLVELLDDESLAPLAAKELKHTLLMFDAYHDVEEKHKAEIGRASCRERV